MDLLRGRQLSLQLGTAAIQRRGPQRIRLQPRAPRLQCRQPPGRGVALRLRLCRILCRVRHAKCGPPVTCQVHDTPRR